MPPDSIISQPFNNVTLDSNFVAAVALFSHRRDIALGLNLSRHTAGLVWYYNKRLSQELSETARRSFMLGIIQGGKERMAEILKLAPAADEDTKKKLLVEAKTIEAAVKNAAKALNGENN